MNDFILLHQNDNVVVALKNMEENAQIEVNGEKIQLKSAIVFGHKIAIKSIKAGDNILKYGLSIGIAITDITAGEHVHVQNLRTDYSVK
ncbi:MAG: UxaA family hydrolase [Bacteroidales bacterium]|nr:UxaA family hydrolase [Bacteroidales bacterium]